MKGDERVCCAEQGNDGKGYLQVYRLLYYQICPRDGRPKRRCMSSDGVAVAREQ